MTTKEFLEYYNNTFDSIGKDIILEFFIAFSRFEFALKASNFVKGGERVSANWDTFVNLIANDFNPNSSIELKTATHYIITNPPQVQSLHENNIVWSKRNIEANTPIINKLRLHITDIRNNLFHGGKFNDTFSPENSRNYVLLKSAIIILNNWLELSPEINSNFSLEIS